MSGVALNCGFLTCGERICAPSETPWPKRLRVHKIGEVYSLTWSFSGPDGRALFTIGPDSDGEPLTWLAIGYHDIYQ